MDDHGDRRSEQGMRGGRRQRLAASLRANLLRRKKQALERSRAAVRDGPAAAAADPNGAGALETPHDSAEIVSDKTFG